MQQKKDKEKLNNGDLLSRASPKRAWMDNPRMLFARRLDTLKVGDSLIDDVEGWQINCVLSDSLLPIYIIMKDGKRIIKRKDKSSVLRYILSKKVPKTLLYVENGALASMKIEEVEEDKKNLDLLNSKIKSQSRMIEQVPDDGDMYIEEVDEDNRFDDDDLLPDVR